jgi:hypothetical protein
MERRTAPRRLGPRRTTDAQDLAAERRGSDRRAGSLARSGEDRRQGERRTRPDRRMLARA